MTNGDRMIDCCTTNEMRNNNTFNYKPQRKYTCENTRAQRLMLDFVVRNRIIHNKPAIDVRNLTFPNVGTEHYLVLGQKWKGRKISTEI